MEVGLGSGVGLSVGEAGRVEVGVIDSIAVSAARGVIGFGEHEARQKSSVGSNLITFIIHTRFPSS